MRVIRWILSKIILTLDALFTPKPVQRDSESQAKIDRETAKLALYQFEACPFCVKVRRAMKRQGLKIELRDILNNSNYEKELIEKGGMRQVPCLRIPKADGFQWLYESDDIIHYLQERFS